MARHSRGRGYTLIEVMVAMAVMLIGSMGLLSIYEMGVRMDGQARMAARATDLADDLITQMQTWDYVNDARLQNVNLANDPDYADENQAFEGTITPALYDHQETELEASPYGWNGVPSATATALGFTRYWNIASVDYDSNGNLTGQRVAAIVVWNYSGQGRRVVVLSFIPNPEVAY